MNRYYTETCFYVQNLHANLSNMCLEFDTVSRAQQPSLHAQVLHCMLLALLDTQYAIVSFIKYLDPT